MEKRTILAIVLSAVVLFAYSAIVSRMHPVVNKEDTAKTSFLTPSSTELPAPKPSAVEPQPLTQELLAQEYIEFENDKLKIVFANPGAYISKVELKEYSAQFFLQDLLLFSDEVNYNFNVKEDAEAITFVFRDANREIIKRFFIPNNSYIIELERTVHNFATTSIGSNYQILLTSKINRQSSYENRFMELSISRPQKILRKNLLGLRSGRLFSGDFDWIGMRDRYFAFIVQPHAQAQDVFVRKDGQQARIGLEIIPISLSALDTSSYVDKFTIYVGPQDSEKLTALNVGFENIIYFGFFDAISQVLLSVLKFLFKFTHNWGGAILLFGLFIFLLLYPLTLKQMRSMKEMQILQPKVKELQQRHKGDSQKLNKEIMQLYREHKVNPLGGCLPILFQIPIFFALYQALMRFVGLRGARFLWIKDLSRPDRLALLSQKLPVIGNEINILPILMMVSMFIQQKFSAAAMSAGGSSEQQKMMMFMMPLLFGFIFYKMPSGLVLYWFVYGALTGIYQWITARKAQAQAQA